MVNMGLGTFAECIKSIFFGEVCDTCDGKAIYSLLAGLIRIFTVGVGILAIIGIMITGITYLKSVGNPAKHNKARSRFINIILGLAVYVSLFVIAEFLMPGGIVNHPISSTEETSCPEITYTDTTIRRPENPGNASGTSPSWNNLPSPYAGMRPTFTSKVVNKGSSSEYNYLEIKNATPYVYAPISHANSGKVIDVIESGDAGKNILIVLNGGQYNTSTSSPSGVVIQDGKVVSDKDFAYQTLVVDQDGEIGFAEKGTKASDLVNGNALYIDGLTGGTVSGKKIISALTHFTPILVNGEVYNESTIRMQNPGGHYNKMRKRQIFCVKADKTNAIITGGKDSGGDGPGGWTYSKMIELTKELGCQFAFNLDGGSSTLTAWRDSTSSKFTRYGSSRSGVPTYITYTENNLPPGKTEMDYQSSYYDETPTKTFDAVTERKTVEGLEYWLNVPQGATDRMPLVIFLHGSEEKNKPSSVRKWKAVDEMFKRTDFISIAPVLTRSNWSDVASALKSIIDKTVTDYGINQQKVHIFGFSLGGIGTWYMVKKNQTFFASAVPISGCAGSYESNLVSTKIRAIAGGNETKYKGCMETTVAAINSLGGSATFETIPGKSHGDMQYGLDYKDIFDWMMGQRNLKAKAPSGPTSYERSSLVGTSPTISSDVGTFKNDGVEREYRYTNIKNGIPYVYRAKDSVTADVLASILKGSNVLVAANGYLPAGVLIENGANYSGSNGKGIMDRRTVFVVDEYGGVGMILNRDLPVGALYPNGYPNDIIEGKVNYYNPVTNQYVSGRKIKDAIRIFGYFVMNGREEWEYEQEATTRQRQVFCFHSDGSFSFLTHARDGRNGTGYGWSKKTMVSIAQKHGCVSALNFDGGMSTKIIWRNDTSSSFSKYEAIDNGEARPIKTYIVFTSDNKPPHF